MVSQRDSARYMDIDMGIAMKKRNPTDAQFPWTYFILAFGITWLIWSPGVLATLGLMELPVPFIVFFFAGTWGPFLAASWMIYRDEGREGVKRFWRQGLDFRIHGLWLLVILGVPLLLAAVPLGVYVLAGGTPPELSLLSQPWMVIPIFLTHFLTGGGNEEWGWRGYALDRLQSRWNPLVASIVLGLIFGGWTAPLRHSLHGSIRRIRKKMPRLPQHNWTGITPEPDLKVSRREIMNTLWPGTDDIWRC